MTHDKRQFPWKDVVHSCGNHHSAQCPGGSFLTALLPDSLAPLPQGQTQGRGGGGNFLTALLPASLAPVPVPNTGRKSGSDQGTALLLHHCQHLQLENKKNDKDATDNEKSFSPSLTATRRACSVQLTSGLTQTGRTVVTRAITGIMIINTHRRLKTIMTNILHESNNVKHVPLVFNRRF